jgi:hypothetical protein
MCAQCLTLAPTVALMADLASDDDKRWLVGALPHLGKPAPSDPHAGVLEMSAAIQKCVRCAPSCAPPADRRTRTGSSMTLA